MIPVPTRIISVLYAGGHSVITYWWCGARVRQTGPAGRTLSRCTEILARGDR